MTEIQLDLTNDFKYDENGVLSLNISSATNNSLTTKADGIYAIGSSSSNTQTKEIDNSLKRAFSENDTFGMRIGYRTPFSAEKMPNQLTATLYLHRCFTANDENGQDLVNFRSNLDYVLPGDMYIYNKAIYIVTSVTSTGSDGQHWSPGNKITSSSKIGDL